jgi:hypothetical protein
VAFSRGSKTPVECVAIPAVDGKFAAIVRDAKTGERVAEGAKDWETPGLAEYQAREIAIARGLDMVQS